MLAPAVATAAVVFLDFSRAQCNPISSRLEVYSGVNAKCCLYSSPRRCLLPVGNQTCKNLKLETQSFQFMSRRSSLKIDLEGPISRLFGVPVFRAGTENFPRERDGKRDKFYAVFLNTLVH